MDIRGILGIEMEDGPRDGLELLLEERFMELAQVRLEKDPEGKERYGVRISGKGTWLKAAAL